MPQEMHRFIDEPHFRGPLIAYRGPDVPACLSQSFVVVPGAAGDFYQHLAVKGLQQQMWWLMSMAIELWRHLWSAFAN